MPNSSSSPSPRPFPRLAMAFQSTALPAPRRRLCPVRRARANSHCALWRDSLRARSASGWVHSKALSRRLKLVAGLLHVTELFIVQRQSTGTSQVRGCRFVWLSCDSAAGNWNTRAGRWARTKRSSGRLTPRAARPSMAQLRGADLPDRGRRASGDKRARRCNWLAAACKWFCVAAIAQLMSRRRREDGPSRAYVIAVARRSSIRPNIGELCQRGPLTGQTLAGSSAWQLVATSAALIVPRRGRATSRHKETLDLQARAAASGRALGSRPAPGYLLPMWARAITDQRAVLFEWAPESGARRCARPWTEGERARAGFVRPVGRSLFSFSALSRRSHENGIFRQFV